MSDKNTISLYLTETELKAIEEIRIKTGLNKNEILRRMLDDYFKLNLFPSKENRDEYKKCEKRNGW